MEEQKIAGPFRPGQSGNPKGRKKGVPNKLSRKVLDALAVHADAMLDVLVDKAIKGDITALKLCLARLCPPQREMAMPPIKLPVINGPDDLPKATEALLKAATSGGITPNALLAMTAVVKAHMDAVQTADLAERIGKLESR